LLLLLFGVVVVALTIVCISLASWRLSFFFASCPFVFAMSSYDSFLAMAVEAPPLLQRLPLACDWLGVTAPPLQMPPWLDIHGQDCVEHVHDHVGIVVLVYMLVAARRSSCAAARRSSYAAVRRSS
jgi:hypothetical protein